jgi:site-specific DNA-methyltransferase (adenine-specific)
MRVVTVTRKPIPGSTTANVVEWGCGVVNIDACRVGAESRTYKGSGVSQMRYTDGRAGLTDGRGREMEFKVEGRWPANIMLQHSPDCRETCMGDCPVVQLDGIESSVTGVRSDRSAEAKVKGTTWLADDHQSREYPNDSGGVARYFKQIGGHHE